MLSDMSPCEREHVHVCTCVFWHRPCSIPTPQNMCLHTSDGLLILTGREALPGCWPELRVGLTLLPSPSFCPLTLFLPSPSFCLPPSFCPPFLLLPSLPSSAPCIPTANLFLSLNGFSWTSKPLRMILFWSQVGAQPVLQPIHTNIERKCSSS